VGTASAPRAAILLAEDDPALAAMLADTLGAKGYRVWHAPSAADAERMVDEARPDLIICDLMLPDTSGLLLCAELKRKADAPIIICSGTKRRDDRLVGFKLGADDFIAKPFEVEELIVRIEAALRRAVRRQETSPAAAALPPSVERVGDLVLDRTACRASLAGRDLALTPTEYRLLSALVTRPDVVHSRQDLAQHVWGAHDPGLDSTLDVHMRRLRAKLRSGAETADVGGNAPKLHTVRGFGYRLVSPPPTASHRPGHAA